MKSRRQATALAPTFICSGVESHRAVFATLRNYATLLKSCNSSKLCNFGKMKGRPARPASERGFYG
jgi:hypothetical protein